MVFKKIEPGIWKPEEKGDEITGILRNVKDSTRFNSKVYSIEVNNKQMIVFGTTVLEDRMSFVNVKDTIKIVYQGMEKNQKGQDTKMFDVFKDESEETAE